VDTSEALKLIAARCPGLVRAAGTAMRAISVQSPVAAQRIDAVVTDALSAHEASFTTDERQALAELITGTTSESKSDVIRLRVTAAEKAAIFEMAAAAGMSLSDYIRGKLGL
jgi:hypothetical protein